MLETVFIAAVALALHSYFGYPLSLYLIGIFRSRPVKKAPCLPAVTFIITAYNEEKRIAEKLENTRELDYPKEKLQVIVASDGSTDRTNEIVRGSKGNVELLDIKARAGKENAQKEAVKRAKGEILVFTDAATRLDPWGLKKIVSNFADPTVGCVSSEDRLIGKDGSPGGEGFYVRYEMWLRGIESGVNSLVGLSGSFFAARKAVCHNFSQDLQSDFRTLLNTIKLGQRGVIDPEAVGYYFDISDSKKEFDRKVRTVLRGLTVFFRHPGFLNAFRYGLFSYQYLCHKLLRWLVPVFLIAALASNILLAPRSVWFLAALVLQGIFYGLAVLGWKAGGAPKNPLLKIPIYFLTVNVSILVAWWRYLRGQRVVMWTPSER